MVGTIFWEWYISWSSWHCKSGNLWSRFYSLNVTVVVARARCFSKLGCQKTSITLWHWELGCSIGWRQVNEILCQISTWSLRLSHIEMLLHAFVTRSLPFIIFIEEPVCSFWMSLLAKIGNWIFLVVLIFWPGDLSHLFRVCKIALSSITDTDSIEIVFLWISWYKTIRQRSILMWNLFLKFLHMISLEESLMSANTIFFIRECSIVLERVFCWWWGWRCLEVNVTTREPCELSPIVQSPFGTWDFSRIDNTFTRHYGEVVIGCSSFIQICGLSFDDFFLSRSIINSSDGVIHWWLLSAIHSLLIQVDSKATFCCSGCLQSTWSSCCIKKLRISKHRRRLT